MAVAHGLMLHFGGVPSIVVFALYGSVFPNLFVCVRLSSMVVLPVLYGFIFVLWLVVVSNNDHVVYASQFLCFVVLFLF